MGIIDYWDLDKYQEWTQTTAIYPVDIGLYYCGLGLAGEAGEVAEKIKKKARDGVLDVDALRLELGDVLYYLARIATETGIRFSDVAFANIEKLEGRKERGTLQGSGDDR